MGRPSKCDDVLIAQMEEMLQEGIPDAWIADALGVANSTFRDWKVKGAAPGARDPYRAFSAAYVRGRHTWREEMIGVIMEDARGGRTSAASARWLLEKRERAEFGNTAIVVEVPIEAPAANVTPEAAAKKLTAIRGGKT